MKSNSRYQASHVNCLPPEIDRPPAAGFREDPTLQNPKDSQSSKRAARIARKQTEISIKGADRRFKRSARVQRAAAGALPHRWLFRSCGKCTSLGLGGTEPNTLARGV